MTIILAVLGFLAICAIAGAYVERGNKVRRAELKDAKLALSAAEDTMTGIERTIRQNADLGDGADILADLVLQKIGQYHEARLQKELEQ